MDTHRKVTAEIEGFLRIHANELPADHDLATAAIVVETALEALVHKAVIDRHELLVEDLVEQETFRRSEEHTSELQSLMRISYAVFCWKNKKREANNNTRSN